MNKHLPAIAARSRKRHAGVAAVELAFCLPILIGFLLLPIFFARVFWHYTIAQKAAQDAARYLSTVPQSEMIAPASAAAAGNLALEIIRRQIAEMSPDAQVGTLQAFCNTASSTDNCGANFAGSVPTSVRVSFRLTMYDPTGLIDFGIYGLQINANYTMRYVGN